MQFWNPLVSCPGRLARRCVTAFVLWGFAAAALCAATLPAEIPPQPLPAALANFAQQTGLQLIYVSKDAAGLLSRGTHAGLEPDAALRELLDGTGLQFEFLNRRTVRIYAAAAITATAGTTSTNMPTRRPASPVDLDLEDILVVGLRDDSGMSIRNFVQNVPASVSVVAGETLQAQNLGQLTDYANFIPGLNVAGGGTPGQALVILRGVPGLTEGASVGYYLDDVPIGPSGFFARGCCSGLDLTPYDLDRLEVLRGPQGTVYGGDGEAGVVRYVLKAPSLTTLEGRVGVGSDAVQGAASPGAEVRMAVSVPLVRDVLGLRVSAFDRYTPGYIDNIRLGVSNDNDYREYGGRIATLWQAAPSLSVKLNAFWYGINAASDAAVSSKGVVVEPNAGNAFVVAPQGSYPDLTDNSRYLQPFLKNLRVFSGTLTWNPGELELVSVTSWSAFHNHYILDTTPVFGALSGQPSIMDRQLYVGKASEELRLMSPRGRRIDWYIGAYFTHEVVGDHQTDNDPVTLLAIDYPSSTRQWAVFGDLTFRPSTKLELTAGLRYAHSWAQQVTDFGYEGVLYSETPAPGIERDVTWLASVGYHVTPDLMLYTRVATGVTPGGRAQIGRDGGLPAIIRPDFTTSYEAGIKSESADHRLLANLTTFYVIRRNVQLSYGDFGPDFLTNTGAESTYTINCAAAASRGAELSAAYAPLEGLKLGLGAAYTQAALTNPALDVGSVPGPTFLAGFQLPNVPRWTLSVTADNEWQWSREWRAHAGAAFRWVDWVWGSTAGVQTQSPQATAAIRLPSYWLLDFNAGLTKGQVALKAYIRNATNRRAWLGGGVTESANDPSGTAFTPVQINYALAQPRTVGVGLDYTF